MIGSFLLNPEDKVAFAQFGEHQKIDAFHLVAGPCCTADLADGSNEMFTDEIHSEILTALKEQKDILVAHIGEDGQAVEEYTVPLTVDI